MRSAAVPRVHTEFALRAFSVSRNAEPTVYNSLPADIRLWYSVDSFIFSERSRLYAAKRLCIQECYRRYIKCCSKLYVACKKSSTKWPITLNLTRSLDKTRATAHKTWNKQTSIFFTRELTNAEHTLKEHARIDNWPIYTKQRAIYTNNASRFLGLKKPKKASPLHVRTYIVHCQ